ncbi:MAG TPA: signal recognition particle protein [Gammaproteobacteria bacterium]|jgi:signal recognition particle subunit SRP54|nr:signal recognition particle protein [Gammaproteobacteria bacterium]
MNFGHLSERLNKVVKNLTGQGRLTESNIKETMRDIRVALLEADVALPVAKAFIENIESKALGTEVMGSLTPGQALIKLVHDELVHTMGDFNASLNLKAQPPVAIMMAGLQGSGKTTTTAKLASWLKKTQNKLVMVVSTDIYRPAAIDQLKVLAETIDVKWFPSNPSEDPITIAQNAMAFAKNNLIDVVLIDTAGRLHIDEDMMSEIKRLHAAINPVETLFVVDSMTGQDAAVTAKAFDDALALTGVILTKTDGDARGGAALSIRHITGKPIKFMGIGEKIDALEPFYPDRVASRILDMGDIVSLAELVERHVNEEKTKKLAKKIKKGLSFDLEDFLEQIEELNKMGGLQAILAKLPGSNQMMGQLQNQFNDKKLSQTKAIICSMTLKERRFPDHIRHSQKNRIAKGSGTDVPAVNRVINDFLKMQKMMSKMKGGGMAKMMRNMQGKFPGGNPFPF